MPAKNGLYIISTKTPDGDFNIIINDKEVALASGFGSKKDLIAKLPIELRLSKIINLTEHEYQKKVKQYYNGDMLALSKIPKQQSGTDFQIKVWDIISDIPYGQTISYSQLANKSGRLKAIRAVGTICGLNRLALLVPCHRVIKIDGSTGKYAYGNKIKTSLIDHELDKTTD